MVEPLVYPEARGARTAACGQAEMNVRMLTQIAQKPPAEQSWTVGYSEDMPGRAAQKEQTRKIASLSRIGPRRQVVIPKAIFDQLCLREGDFMEVTATGGNVSMKPKKLVGSENLTASEAKKVRHGLKQAGEGKTRPWAKVKHELGM